MSSQISLKVGNVTATLPVGLNMTDAQVATALTRFATSLGISMTGTPQENLMSVLLYVVDDIRRRSRTIQVSDAFAIARSSIIAQADADNQL